MTTIKVRPNTSSPFVTLGVAPTMAYTTDLGAVTGGSPVTVTHNLGTFDVAVQIVEKDTAGAGAAAGTLVDATVELTSVNALTVTFTSNAAANLYRVTVLAVGSVGEPVQVIANAQTDSYTLVLTDAGKMIEMGKATAQNLTVPLNSSVAFPVGTRIDILQTGAGQVTVVATGGVTVNAKTGLKIADQWGAATLIKRATDTWVLAGALSA